MVDVSNAKWELSKDELYALEWFKANNFHATLKKQYVSKTVFEISKDGIIDTFELPQGYKINIKSFMEIFNNNWELLKLIKENE